MRRSSLLFLAAIVVVDTFLAAHLHAQDKKTLTVTAVTHDSRANEQTSYHTKPGHSTTDCSGTGRDPADTGTVRIKTNSTISQKSGDWFDNQNILVREGDAGFLNFLRLIRELRGRDVTTDTIFQAMGRISHRPGRPLAYVQKKRKQIDPSYKPGQFLSDYNKTSVDYEHERQAAYAHKQESASARNSREEAAAKSEAESLRGWSHSENDQLGKIFVTDERTREIDWTATRDARLRLQKLFENRRATGSRI